MHGVWAQSLCSIQYSTMHDPDIFCAIRALNACCWPCKFTGPVPKYIYLICMSCLHCPNYAECIPCSVPFCASGSRQQLCTVWYSVLYFCTCFCFLLLLFSSLRSRDWCLVCWSRSVDAGARLSRGSDCAVPRRERLQPQTLLRGKHVVHICQLRKQDKCMY